MWTQHLEFSPIVEKIWSTPINGCKKESRALHKQFGGLFGRVAQKEQEWRRLQEAISEHLTDDYLLDQEKTARRVYIKLKKAEMSYIQQRAKLHYLKLSDTNTHYFHARLAERRAQNRIGVIVNGSGQERRGQKEIENAFLEFFKGLFGVQKDYGSFDGELMAGGTKLTSCMQEELVANVTPQEVQEALFSMHDDKSPGPDGYGVGFFKKAWG